MARSLQKLNRPQVYIKPSLKRNHCESLKWCYSNIKIINKIHVILEKKKKNSKN